MKCYRNSGIFRKISLAKSASLPNFYLLSTLMPEAVRKLVAESLKKRSLASQDDKDGLVEMIPELQLQITQLYSMKSK